MRTTTALLDSRPGIRHGFFGRQGGTSQPPYDSLNMALRTGDERARVLANRRIVAEALEGRELVVARQVHGTDTVRVATPWAPDDAPDADALVTTEPGLVLAVTTADCAPILLGDADARVIGAAHAGWKGALSGIVESVVQAMAEAGADPARIAAAVGPCIQRRSYQVGPEFEARFLEEDPASEAFFTAGRGDRAYFDLESYVCMRLGRAGVRTVQASGLDTVALPERFFSYRRTTLAGGGPFGTQASAIVLA
ncbi:peptidoglycan editing factor PgeF [Geminicoccus roseus]|uniref:peptidoglycan editing factor PgeF n=1 Tax=Geminicoccus roseus TaxID=404900 RepID=UPI0004257A9D|nr:peptidoglycan editing factor PgeF [Geminicoccus roseus]